MSYYWKRLKRPYDYRGLIEAYIYTQRTDFIHHPEKASYYASLLDALEKQFGIRLSHGLSLQQKVLRMLFQATVRSLLQISSPWEGFIETTLLDRTIEECGELGSIVDRASTAISEANETSEAAHREMLDALFYALYGKCDRIVTSDELRAAGFDDSKEPDFTDPD